MESPCSLPKFKKWVNKAACVVKNWPHTCTGQLFTSGIFMCAETSSIAERSYETQYGNEASQSFASQIQPTPERIAFSIKVIHAGVGRVSLVKLLWLYVSANHLTNFNVVWATCCLFRQLSSHPGGCTTFMPFGQLSNRSAWFVNGTTSPESQPKN